MVERLRMNEKSKQPMKAFGPPIIKPPRSPSAHTSYKEDLIHRLEMIETRLAEISSMIEGGIVTERDPSDNSPPLYRDQEILGERKDLLRSAAGLKYAISIAMPAHDSNKEQEFLSAETDRQIETKLNSIRRFEGEGDWRQARIHRMSLIDIRERVRKEFLRRPKP